MQQRLRPASPTPPPAALPTAPRWGSWLPAVFVSLYLALLALAFLWLGRRIEERQAVIQELIRPSRDRLVQIQRALALGIAASGAYAVRPEPRSEALFAASEAQMQAAERELGGFAAQLGGDAQWELARFIQARERWAAAPRALMRGELSLAAFRSRLVAQQEVVAEVTAAAARLEAAFDSRSSLLMSQIRGIGRLRRGLVGAAALLALVAAVVAAVYGERNRRLTVALAARAEQEGGLREIAANLTATENLPAALRRIAAASLTTARAQGAYIERVVEEDSRMVEVIAAAGRRTPAVGTRALYAGSATEAISETREPELVADLGDGECGGALRAGEARGACPTLILPLRHDGGVLGALVLALRQGEPPLVSAGALRRLRILANLTALALRRSALFQRERAAREELSKLLESIADAFVALDRERRFTYANHRAEELCAARREELLGRGIEESFPEAHGTELERALERALRQREAAPFETASPVLGRWLEGVAYPARDGGVTMFFRDISERKRAELERARLVAAVESERRLLEAVVQQMPAGVIIAEAPSGRILIGNRQIDRIWRARLSGARHIGQYRSWMMLHADGRPYSPDELPLARALLRGQVVEAEAIDIQRGDGSRATIRASAAPVRDERGEVVAAVATFYDITRQRRLEQGLRLLGEAGRVFASSLDYEDTLRAVVRLAVPRLADWSTVHLMEPGERKARALETAHADPSQRPLLDELTRRFPLGVEALQPIADVIRTGEPRFTPEVDEEMLKREIPDRTVRELVLRLGPRSGMVLPLRAGGRVIGALAFAFAESGRRYDRADFDLAQELADRASMAVHNAHLYRETQDALRARDEVLAIVSHDLRNPLHTIGMTVEVLLELRPPREQQEQHLEAVLRASRQMDRLIQDLLDVSRIQAGKPLAIEPSAEPPARLVQAAAEAFRAAAQEKGIRIEVQAAEDLPFAHADEGRILQVLSNLLANALKFTPEDGVVRLSAGAVPEGVRFSVEDTGPGIAPEDLELIFQPFWQVRRTARLGTGLGLGIARGIIEEHGGRIWAESRPGVGSTFSFTLPPARREPGSTRAA